MEQIRRTLYSRLRHELKPISGIAESLRRLRGPRCVASSSQPERIRLSLEVTGLLELLQPHLYSATMVAKGKPAPDLFLFAARSMGAQPGDCVVVEDSPAGIEAARNAGMKVLAFTGGSHAAESGLQASFSGLHPDLVFNDMHRLPELLATLRRKVD